MSDERMAGEAYEQDAWRRMDERDPEPNRKGDLPTDGANDGILGGQPRDLALDAERARDRDEALRAVDRTAESPLLKFARLWS